ncbi:alpha/beta hydrolase [Candidatus Woesearchaeota archaeon]|nr:alpha/beta hydrolase [Candidatus Woesearchaeota archaeon]HIH54733.1 alpha/beta hydrolase [Candidatus Woesearchaeota archaeon]
MEKKGKTKIMAVLRHTHTKKSILILTILLIIALVFFAYSAYTTLISEELRLSIMPDFDSFSLMYGQSKELSVEIGIYKKFLCKAECNYEFMDLSENKLLETGTFSAQSRVIRSKVMAETKGYGKKLFQYTVNCNVIPTSTCRENNSYRRRSTFLMNYAPNKEQSILIENIGQDYKSATGQIDNLKYALQRINAIHELKNVKFDYFIFDESALATINNLINQSVEYWGDYDYENSEKTLIGASTMLSEINNIVAGELIKSEITVAMHNDAIGRQASMIEKSKILRSLLGYFPDATSEAAISLINANTVLLEKKDFENYEKLNLSNAESLILLASDNMFNYSRQSSSDYLDIYVVESLSCLVLKCKSGTEIYNANKAKELYYSNDLNTSSYIVMDKCELINSTFKLLEQAKAITAANRQRANATVLKNAVEEESKHIYSMIGGMKKYDIPTINERSIYYLDRVKVDKAENVSTSYTDFYDLSVINISKCYQNDSSMVIDELDAGYAELPTVNRSSGTWAELTMKQICCIKNNCDVCNNNHDDFPLILLHGHSFNTKNSAFQSTDIFNDMEDAFVEDDYISLGALKSKIPDLILADFGRLLIKPTYYIESYNDALGIKFIEGKQGNIDTYALRLKEQIDEIKKYSGKQRVDIVAHSMGGLVVRRYMQIFGDSSINKFIMIGTPNRGIDKATFDFCKLYGEKNECNDMKENSLFLNKLNSESLNHPETYSVIGIGCGMSGKDGDGVVIKESAEFLNNYYVTGTCKVPGSMHGQIVDPKKYPEIYKYILGMLE